MSIQESREEYIRAMHLGQKEIKECQAMGKSLDPLVHVHGAYIFFS